ncbi:hypothetical protein V8918_02780 [Ralstonia mannitolilytica]|uniref:hypothetical protein n=1 Tax=Ralstonia mannitolilytica TaxID=105219 RepID=UPI003B83C522
MKKIVSLLVASAAYVTHAAMAQQVQGPGGIQTSCNTLLAFGSQYTTPGPDTVLFGVRLADWTDETVDFLKRAVDACGDAKRIRPDYIERTKERINRAPKVAEQRRLAQEKQATEDLQRKQLAECRSSNGYELYSAQERVIADIENIKGWRENQAQERRIARTSGVRNLWEERNNGEWIVQSSDDLKADFAEYKRLGGKAKTPQKVAHEVVDPCPSAP